MMELPFASLGAALKTSNSPRTRFSDMAPALIGPLQIALNIVYTFEADEFIDRHMSLSQRRASLYRQRAHRLREMAELHRNETERRHMINLAKTFEDAAARIEPPPKPVGRWART
jgi:hypothetical protein